MPKRVFIDDGSNQETPTEFAYKTKRNMVEYVRITDDNTVVIADCVGGRVDIYTEDIDKLIKALQTAKEYL